MKYSKFGARNGRNLLKKTGKKVKEKLVGLTEWRIFTTLIQFHVPYNFSYSKYASLHGCLPLMGLDKPSASGVFSFMSSLTTVSKRKVLLKSNCRCFYCGEDLSKSKFEIDHILPFSKSKDGRMVNLAAACQQCNRIKTDLTIEEFRDKLSLIIRQPIQFFFEKYGINIEKEGVTYLHTLNEKTFNHG